ncbi:MAG: PucR family transcriptional regulator [Lachnospiraceae bacterium]|nr:PucR family transcriptional regulator [Lachnospiraceae bacterium]
MALSVKKFYEYGKNEYSLTLLAGGAALNRTVSWLYLLEDTNNLSFLREGNLVITTCMSMKNPETELQKLVCDIAIHKVSGILINTGRYIDVIPPSLISWCSANEIPLFTMPWEIHIADLMQYFCNLIISEKRNREQRDYFLFHALTKKSTILRDSDKEAFSGGYLLASFEDLSVYYDAAAQIEGIHYYYCSELPAMESSLQAGISSCISHPKELSKAGIQAYRALLTGKIRNTFPCEYHSIGLYNAVFAIQDPDVFEDARNRLAVLEDETTRKIFRRYLENGGHIRQIADELYLHRNTVNYHVCKAKDLLHITDNASLLECLFYFYLCDYENLLIR